MPIIISCDGQPTVKIARTAFSAESELQEYIAANPDCLPVNEIESDLKLQVIGREFPTGAGPVDVLAADSAGTLCLIETKLYKNPDKRQVVAQVLDYGAAIWSSAGDGDFVRRLDEFLTGSGKPALRQHLQSAFATSDEEAGEVVERLRANVVEGRFRFLVLMDHIPEQLKDLLLFLNENSHFEVFAVEVEHYRHNGTRIVIPRLFGAQTRKRADAPSINQWTREAALTDLESRPLDPRHRELLLWLFDFSHRLAVEGATAEELGVGSKPSVLLWTKQPDGGRRSTVLRFGVAKSNTEASVSLQMLHWRGDVAKINDALAPLNTVLGTRLEFQAGRMVPIVDALLKSAPDRDDIEKALRTLIAAL